MIFGEISKIACMEMAEGAWQIPWWQATVMGVLGLSAGRSEERRVGKECM